MSTPNATWDLDWVKERCDEVGDCWLWKLSLKDKTQPQARINGQAGVILRRWIYDTLLEKKRPAHSIVAVSCHELKCCAPAHLVWSTRSASARLSYKNGRRDRVAMTEARRAQAISRGFAKINMVKADEIRIKAGATSNHDLAAEYGLTVGTIRAIVRNQLWRPTRVASVFEWRP